MGLPYTTMSSQATVDGGMGAKDLFSALVLQRGGTFYNENASKAILDSKNVMDAFKQWTEYYQKYELPLTYDFYNRFRSGEMPMGIQGYGMYNMLEAAAPEIKGMWSMHLLPGTQTQDGKIDRTEGASGTATIMINNRQDEATKTAAWEFMKWWTSAESQARYGVEIETLMGTASRYNPANIAAMEQLSWSQEELSILKEAAKLDQGEFPKSPAGIIPPAALITLSAMWSSNRKITGRLYWSKMSSSIPKFPVSAESFFLTEKFLCASHPYDVFM